MTCKTTFLPLFALALTACPAPSEEIGATLDGGTASDSGDGDGSTAADATATGDGATSQGPGDAGSGDAGSSDAGSGDGSTGATAGSGSDGSPDTCFDAWAEPTAVVEATSRPAASVPGMRLRFEYDAGVVTLTEITDEQIVQPPDGPFSPDENSGSWVELRDASDQEVYTRGVFELIPESMEVFDPMGNIVSCPEQGFLQVTHLPNDPSATQVVFFQEAIDGEMTQETIELVRFDLPPA